MQPRVDRPAIPPEYGTAKATEFLDWSHVEERLTTDRVYWLATVDAAGRPRVRPVDGLYVDGVIYVGGSPKTRWVRDVATNQSVAVHLDGVDRVLTLDGEVEVMTALDDALAERIAAASKAKFPEYGMTAAFYKRNGAIAIRPRTVIAWTDITRDPTRFRFDD
ncbi:MAG TPA: pyridoxamine 5'-phosphate oxidase family protein [Candidatus Limnocylindria bacterium]|nr:pyridoxamine 5'-phosphate oxidase family protein [Candidatus Limnocylindria bacterium]